MIFSLGIVFPQELDEDLVNLKNSLQSVSLQSLRLIEILMS